MTSTSPAVRPANVVSLSLPQSTNVTGNALECGSIRGRRIWQRDQVAAAYG
jgi:hypothetical protein